MDYFSDLCFVNSGYVINTANRANGRLFDGYYGVQYNHAGSVELAIGNGRKSVVSGPWAFISFPGTPFTYGAPEGMFRTHYHVCFNGDRVKRYIESGLLQLKTESPFIKINDSARFVNTFQLIINLLNVPGKFNHMRAGLTLEDLLLQLHEQTEIRCVSPDGHDSLGFHDLRDRIGRNPAYVWDFRKEASKLGVSYIHFRRIFKQITGWPPGHFLLECRLRRAENRLINTSDRVSEIAEECGFQDEYHFSKIFKKYRYISPAHYRNEFKLKS